ncbi:hypothetical protein ACFOWX_03980 [Sphingorhabdus arenilitoris]|uniref:Uncharacterized protein n=1 Tax=Sphingorhabdus arenilitoris TaxID=1490041 RepID=A0ABV8RF48_9SPHN
MMTYLTRLLIIAALPASLANAANAQAQNMPGTDQASELQKNPAHLTEQKPETPSGMVSLGELSQLRGGAQIAINNQTLNSTNTGNVIGGNFTAGDVNLGDNALSNFNGLGNFVFNTGAQSSLQAGLSVTLNVSE